MRELHGIISFLNDAPPLKQYALLFDKLHIMEFGGFSSRTGGVRLPCADEHKLTPKGESYWADFDFLQARGFVEYLPKAYRVDFDDDIGMTEQEERWVELGGGKTHSNSRKYVAYGVGALADVMVRRACLTINDPVQCDTVPLYRSNLARMFYALEGATAGTPMLRMALGGFPIPDQECPWEELLAFKAEERDKEWSFRRFLKGLATKGKAEAEVRDEIEYLLNEYAKAMAIHKMKSSQSFVDVFVVSPLEIIENLVKFNWSKIAKGALQVQKRKIELMEAEMKAPGREVAYIYDAQKRFG